MHLLMMQNLFPPTTETINPAFWSLALEWQMYLLFPLFLFCARRWGLFSLTAGAFVLSVAWGSLVAWRIGLHPHWSLAVDLYHAVPSFAYLFIVGMYAAALVARPTRSYVVPATAIAVVLSIPAIFYEIRVSMVGPLVDVAWGTIFAALVVAIGPFCERHVVKNVVFRPLITIGLFSYSLYLMHFPLIGVSDSLLSHVPIVAHSKNLAQWLRLLPMIGFSYLFFLLFERPFIVKRKSLPVVAAHHEAEAAQRDTNPGTQA
jgi:peptidoglycan/LPS O-acetylase OafA/YrhL